MTLASRLKTTRQVHNYVGVFFAPTILFFAITGGLQMFGLHESSRGSSYMPPALLVRLAQLHKKGTLHIPQSKRPSPPMVARPTPPSADVSKQDTLKPSGNATGQTGSNPLPMKIFFGATALALVLSTSTGLFMAWQYARRKAFVVLIFVAGILAPLLMLLL